MESSSERRRARRQVQDEDLTWNPELPLPEVPLYHALERSSLQFPGETCPLNLLQKASHFFRMNSIHATYEKNSAVCSTNWLKFVLFLWQTPQGGIILEAQRRRGSCLCFRHVRKALFESLKQNSPQQIEIQQQQPRQSPRLSPGLRERARCMTPSLKREEGSCCRTALRLLQSSKLDEKRLGLEYWNQLMGSDNCQKAQIKMTRALIQNQGHPLLVEILRKSLLEHICEGVAQISSSGSQEAASSISDECGPRPDLDESATSLFRLALTIFDKSLSNALSWKEDQEVSLDTDSFFWHCSVEMLIEILEDAARNTNTAAAAASSLKKITLLSRELTAKQIRLCKALSEGIRVGSLCHLKLEENCREFFDTMMFDHGNHH